MERIKKIWLQKMALESCSLEARKTKKGFQIFFGKKEIERIVDARENEASLETIATKNFSTKKKQKSQKRTFSLLFLSSSKQLTPPKVESISLSPFHSLCLYVSTFLYFFLSLCVSTFLFTRKRTQNYWCAAFDVLEGFLGLAKKKKKS